MADQYHIVSLNIWLRLGQCAQVRAAIEATHNAEFLWSDGVSKIVATLKARSDEELAEGLRAVGSIKNVLNVARIYHQIEHEPAVAAQRSRGQRPSPKPREAIQVSPSELPLPEAWLVRAS